MTCLHKKILNLGALYFKSSRCKYTGVNCSYQLSAHIHTSSKEIDSEMKILNVAEKNDAAKNIAQYLSEGNCNRREGLSKYNKIYCFPYKVMGRNAQMVMTSVSGHLLQHEFTGSYKIWKACSPLTLFEAPVIKYCPEKYQDIKRTLEREVRWCDMLIIWTDCDREGENIGFEVINTCKAVKPNIQVFRARFSEITRESVTRAIENLQAPNKYLSDAVEVRSELDLRIGAAFTRFQTLRLQKVFPNVLGDQLISYGSCQFPTLGFVVERYKAASNFIPEPFWKIAVNHTIDEVSVDFSWKRVRLFDELACQVLLERVQEEPMATVEKITNNPKNKWRPLPLDTVQLEIQSSKKLKINAKETLRIAESLYTRGFISYPRTETNIFPKELNLSNIVQMQVQSQQWGAFAQKVLDDGPNPRQGKKSDQAHPPIHPTNYAQNLQGNEGRIYEFIVRHFLACCSKDARGHETVINIDINDEKFVASGLMIIERNYLDVYPYERWSDREIHVYEEGQRFQPTCIEMAEGETSAPKPLTEAELIALMEKHGIGTDATHAEHIDTVKSREYVGEENKFLLPGQLGMGLVEGYDDMGYAMSKPHLRAGLENDLKLICEGRRNPKEVLDEQIASYRLVFEEAMRQAAKIDAALAKYFNAVPNPVSDNPGTLTEVESKVIRRCPKCGNPMNLREKRDGNGFFIGCMGYPDCRFVMWLPTTVQQVSVTNESCRSCGDSTKLLEFKFRPNSYRPLYPDNYTGCIGGCDPPFMEILDLPVPSRATPINVNVPAVTSQSNNDLNETTRSSDSGFSSNASQQRPGNTFNNFLNPPQPRTPAMFTIRNAPNTTNCNNPSDGNATVCQCNVGALKLSVRKAGPNQGREFYKCGNNSACNFFLWAEEEAPGNAGGGYARDVPNDNPRPSTSNNTRNNPTNNSGPDQLCSCGQATKRLTVVKEGPNKGRPFYVCAKPRADQCNFFKWADEDDGAQENVGGNGVNNNNMRGDADGGNNARWNANAGWRGNNNNTSDNSGWGRGNPPKLARFEGGRGRGTGRGAGSQTKSKRKCGICKQEGHTRKTCPQAR